MESEIDRRFGAASAVRLYQTVVVEGELSQRVYLSI